MLIFSFFLWLFEANLLRAMDGRVDIQQCRICIHPSPRAMDVRVDTE